MKRWWIVAITVIISVVVLWKLFLTPTYSVGGEIILGQSAALTGPAKELGENMRKGADAYFRYINDKGGVHGRTIKLITYDDAYEPLYASQNSQKLIHDDKVFALFGEVGTPTSVAATKISRVQEVPFLTPFTGAEFLRDPYERTFVNLRASYYMETAALVEHLTAQGIKRIAIFYQNDSYGKAGLAGVQRAMQAKGLPIVAQGRYRRNTLSYFDALQSIKLVKPEAVIIIGAYKPSAEFIKSAKNEGMKDVQFCNISFVGSKALVKTLEGQTENVIISQVVPLPWDGHHEAIREYQTIFNQYYPKDDFGFVSLEGFLSAKLVVKALEKSGKKLTRKSFLYAVETLPEDSLTGLHISLNSRDHQALGDVYITDFHQGEFRLLKEVSSVR
jgi:ABC-type branched-subunit amino acid transport system substrate-binding protein